MEQDDLALAAHVHLLLHLHLGGLSTTEKLHRGPGEHTFAQMHNRRRPMIRTCIHEGFVALADCLICWRRLKSLSVPAESVMLSR